MKYWLLSIITLYFSLHTDNKYTIFLSDSTREMTSYEFKLLKEHSSVAYSMTDGALSPCKELYVRHISSQTFDEVMKYCQGQPYTIQLPCRRKNGLRTPLPLTQAARFLEITGLLEICINQMVSIINEKQTLKKISHDLLHNKAEMSNSFYQKFLSSDNYIHEKIVTNIWQREWHEKIEIPKKIGQPIKIPIFYIDLKQYILLKSHHLLEDNEQELAREMIGNYLAREGYDKFTFNE